VIKLKTLLEVQLIKEALPLDTARKYVSLIRNPNIEKQQDAVLTALKALPDAKSSRRTDRVAIPYESKEVSIDISELSDEYTTFWYRMRDIVLKADRIDGKEQYTTRMPDWEDLLTGTVADEYGRKTKVSKWITGIVTKTEIQGKLNAIQSYIEKDERGRETLMGDRPMEDVRKQIKDEARKQIEDLIAKYNAIPEVKLYRENKTKTFYIVFSKHRYDVAGMSTGRGWTSCMNLYSGINAQYIQHDVRGGTLVAYLVRNDDLNIENPVARIAIKPFVSVEDPSNVLYQAEQRAYGTPPVGFLDEVNMLLANAQSDKQGIFKLRDTLYCDTGNDTVTRWSDPDIKEKISTLIKDRRLATTTDEIKYILYHYTQGGSNLLEKLKTEASFEESDKLYVSAPNLKILYKIEMPYSPIAFKQVNTFNITPQPETFDNFPQTVNTLVLRHMNIDSFEGLSTNITDVLDLKQCSIKSFKGLSPGLNQIKINDSNVRSFAGIPQTVDYIYLNSTKTNMTVDELIKDLKSCNIKELTPGGDFYSGYNLERTKQNNILAADIWKLMEQKEPNFMNYDDGVIPIVYARVVIDILAQLPTLTNWSSYSRDSWLAQAKLQLNLKNEYSRR
jgi:hypothetical protein